MESQLTQAEIEERASILRKFRAALLRQRERFSKYLKMLEQADYSDEMWMDPEQIEIHVEIEQTIVREISSFQQVIEPLEAMYKERDPQGAADLPALRAALDRTRDEVLRRTGNNRDLLKQHIRSIRSEIAGLKLMNRHKSIYSSPEPVTVDISA